MYSMITWKNETSRPETRENTPFALIAAYGRNAGFYKVQAVDENGIIVQEWKVPL